MSKVLFITPISGLINPSNGGQIRSRQIINELSRSFEVDILTTVKIESKINGNVCFMNNRIIRLIFKLKQTRGLSRFIYLIDIIFCLLQKKKYTVNAIESFIVQNIIKRNSYSKVILDTLTWVQPSEEWPKNCNKIILNAHNIETVLNGKINYNEKKLNLFFHKIIVCTEEDSIRLRKMNNEELSIVVWQNAASIPIKPNITGVTEPIFLFVGSLDYNPNIDGIKWFFKEIFPKLEQRTNDSFKFIIAGRNPSKEFIYEVMNFKNVEIIANPELISIYYETSKFAIAPLLQGSGSRLKIPEALIHGCPIISTKIGAEGFCDKNIPGIIIADSEAEFVNEILFFLGNNIVDREAIAMYAEKNLSWSNSIRITELD